MSSIPVQSVGNLHSDQMLCNFFMLTCPYLYDRVTRLFCADVTCRTSLLPIRETAQVMADIYRYEGSLYCAC